MLGLLSKHPERVFELAKDSKGQFFDSLVKEYLDPIAKDYSVLDEIYVDGLDSNQVYGQTRMVLEGVGERLIGQTIPELRAETIGADSGVSDSEEEEDDDDEEIAQDEDGSENDLEESLDNLGDDMNEIMGDLSDKDSEDEDANSGDGDGKDNDKTQTFTKDAFGLNDEFFDIDSFNKQILSLEKPEDDDEIDYMESMSDDDDDDEEVAYFDDFFPKPGKYGSNGEAALPAANDVDDNSDAPEDFSEGEYDRALGSAMLDMFEDRPKDTATMSSFEAHQKQIQQEVAKLEAELVAEKKWTMKGEVTAKSRPEDSLVDDPETLDLEFDRTAKPIPVVTQEHTETIEDMIRRRIREEEFDDLARRVVQDVLKFHKERAEVSEQKSTKSLAEIYEDEYHQVDPQSEVSEETKKQHDEIDLLFASLNNKLDALCSANYVPKPHQGRSVEIKVDDVAAPAIAMEDAQPAYVSAGATLAPQEVFKAGKEDGKVALKSGLSYSKDELSREDKQRLRRASKRKRAKTFSQKVSKPDKKSKTSDVVSTLARAKNVTLIDKKGRHTDVKGKERKQAASSSSQFML